MSNMKNMQPITKMWYDYLNEGKLMGLKCEHCGKIEFPPVPVCNTCGKHDMEWAPISGKAKLISYCWSPAGADPYWKQPVMIGEFDLEEGNHIQTFLLGVTKEDEPYLYDHCPLDCVAEIVKVSEERNLSYPVFRLKKDIHAAKDSTKNTQEQKVETSYNQEKLEEVNDALAEVFEVDVKTLTPQTSFTKDLNADSLKRVMFIAQLEEISGIKLTLAQLVNMNTLSDLYAGISSWLSA